MNTINKPATDNLGGVVKLYAIRRQDVATIGTNSFTVTSTDDVLLIYCTPGTLSFNEEQSSENGNNFFNVQIAGFVPGDSETVRTRMMELAGRKYLVLFQDGNGNYKLAGNLSQQLRFSSALATGADTADRAGHTIRFAGRVTTKSIFINTPITWIAEGSS